MAGYSAPLAQPLTPVLRAQSERPAAERHSGAGLRSASRWSQWVAMLRARFTGRRRLRGTVESLAARARRLPALGGSVLPRSTLARLNEDKPYSLYEALCAALLARGQALAPGHGLPVGVDHDGYLPSLVVMSEGKVSDIAVGRGLDFPKSGFRRFEPPDDAAN